MSMVRNTSNLDRVIRMIVGLGLLVAALTVDVIINSIALEIIVLALATMNFISAFTAFCPIYTLAGISTWKGEGNASSQSL